VATALNMTMKLKQDPESQKKLQELKSIFPTVAQPMMDKALRNSQMVHFARVLVIDDKYIQVITEFDGDKKVYTDFFRMALPVVFEKIFELVEGAPSWNELNDRDKFYAFSSDKNLKALGVSSSGDPKEGYLFSAYGDKMVKEILPKLA